MAGVDSEALARALRRAERERAARRSAESLLEEKSRALFVVNTRLEKANEALVDALASAETATALNRRLAQSDPLTGLANRRRLFEWLERARSAFGGCGGCAIGLLHADLDRFKNINDALGHLGGDAILVAAADALRAVADGAEALRVSQADGDCGLAPIVARMGGDEFVVAGFLRDAGRDASNVFAELGERVTRALARLAQPDGSEWAVGASVGLVVRRPDAPLGDLDELLGEADLALYRSKARGRGVVTAFDEPLRMEAERKRAIRASLPGALRAGGVAPYYQPQVDARTHRIVGAEALARWRREDGSVAPPAAFLEVARELGLLHEIDDAICSAALRDLNRWRAAGLDLPKVSVNVSAARLADPRLLSGLAPAEDRRGLCFELLETMLLDDVDEPTRERLDALDEAGVRIEIDDFGSGHASIIGLMRIRPSRIKLDRGLVRPLRARGAQREVLRSIVEIAHAMGVHVTAEGVETFEQASILREIGVDILQGYAFSPPVSADRFERLLRQGFGGDDFGGDDLDDDDVAVNAA